jgi:hypothetical protein
VRAEFSDNEPTAGLKDARGLADDRCGLGAQAKEGRHDDNVKSIGCEGRSARIGAHDRERAPQRPFPRLSDHGGIAVETNDGRASTREFLRQRAVAAAEVEYASARLERNRFEKEIMLDPVGYAAQLGGAPFCVSGGQRHGPRPHVVPLRYAYSRKRNKLAVTASRKDHWDRVYTDKTPQTVSWSQAIPSMSLALIKRAGVSLREAVLDVGGGASVLVDRLLA